jgi:hypothetical protein
MKSLNIKEVKTAVKVANIVQDNGQSPSYWKPEWVGDRETIKDNSGRVYIIVSDGIIKKIGGSQSKGGIINTISSYKGGLAGKPSIRTYGINVLITEEMKAGRKVEIWMIQSPVIQAPVKGLFSEDTIDVAAFKEMENKCVLDYKNITGDYPEWNFQESGKKWPDFVNEGYVTQLKKSIK